MQQIVLLLVVLIVCSTVGRAFYVTNGVYVPVTYDQYPSDDGSMIRQAMKKNSVASGVQFGEDDARRLMIEMPKRDLTLRRQQLKRMKPCFYSPIQCLMKRAL